VRASPRNWAWIQAGSCGTVATGMGEAVYYCNGHALNIYKALGIPQFFNTCGQPFGQR